MSRHSSSAAARGLDAKYPQITSTFIVKDEIGDHFPLGRNGAKVVSDGVESDSWLLVYR